MWVPILRFGAQRINRSSFGKTGWDVYFRWKFFFFCTSAQPIRVTTTWKWKREWGVIFCSSVLPNRLGKFQNVKSRAWASRSKMPYDGEQVRDWQPPPPNRTVSYRFRGNPSTPSRKTLTPSGRRRPNGVLQNTWSQIRVFDVFFFCFCLIPRDSFLRNPTTRPQ